jgi:molybdopterin-binding protein
LTNNNNACFTATTLLKLNPISLANNTNTRTPKTYYNTLDKDDFGIMDSRGTDNHLKGKVPTLTKNLTHDPIRVTIPNGATMTSSAQATPSIQNLLLHAQTGFAIPGLKKLSFLSPNYVW